MKTRNNVCPKPAGPDRYGVEDVTMSRDPFLHNAVARLVGEMRLKMRSGFTADEVLFYRDLLVLEAYGASRPRGAL